MIFIAATDDMEWLKEAFAVKTEDFSANDIFFSADLFSSVGIEAPGAGEDLALLSLCNHSIISVSCGKYFCIFANSHPFARRAHLDSGEHCWLEDRFYYYGLDILNHLTPFFCQFIYLQAQSLLTATEFSNYGFCKKVFDIFPI